MEVNWYEFHIDLDTETDMSEGVNIMNDLILRLDRIRRETEDLERDIAKIRGELDKKPDMTPRPEDIGRWVKVRNGNDEPWRNTDLLKRVDNDSIPFVTGSGCWKQARIVPGVGRVTMQEHDGSDTKPEWLADDDKVLVEFDYGTGVRFAGFPYWSRVRRYQKLEIK